MRSENLNKYIKTKISKLLESEFTFKTLFELIHDQDDRVFCEYYSSFRVQQLSYKDFKKYVFSFATYLDQFINTPKQSFIGIYMENSLNWIACFWALLMLGYKPLLLNCKLPSNLNIDICKMCNCQLFISENELIDLNIERILISKSLTKLKEVESCNPYIPSEWGDEIALSTTATTLNVKLCVYSGSNLIYQILNTKSIVKQNKMIKGRYNNNLKLLMFLPLYHVFGLIASYFWFSFFGRIFVFLPDYSPSAIINTVRKHKVTHIFAVPLLWNSLVKEIKKEVDKQDDKTIKKYQTGLKFSYKVQRIFPKLGLKLARNLFKQIQDKTLGDSIKFMISGGSYLPNETLRTLNCLGYPLFVGYGASEIGITSVELRENIKYRVSNSIGKSFDNVTYVIDNDILKVKSLSMAKAIFTKEDQIEIKEGDFFLTNDLVSVDKKGNYYILGRTDDVFIGVNGEKINPDIIEKDINFKLIDRFSILNLNINNKSCLAMVVEIQKGTNSIVFNQIVEEINTISKIVREKHYHLDRVFYTYNRIANPNAIKVSRKILRKLIDEGKVNIVDISNLKVLDNDQEINNEISNEIKTAFSKVLNIDVSKVGYHSNYFTDLGGTSLDYCQLITEIENTFNIKVNINDGILLTVEEFTNYIIKILEGGKS